eukprot:TRINITY_DN8203_c0_g2_i3.p2 TRINITY_DN8203_c0_g2~~TRINITY_DN8203_c0_g2_i3.p2  ORF type:complete len:153 (-),score=35.58 TRINITY_DN8203_c0_g2_i3:398-856(-)
MTGSVVAMVRRALMSGAAGSRQQRQGGQQRQAQAQRSDPFGGMGMFGGSMFGGGGDPFGDDFFGGGGMGGGMSNMSSFSSFSSGSAMPGSTSTSTTTVIQNGKKVTKRTVTKVLPDGTRETSTDEFTEDAGSHDRLGGFNSGGQIGYQRGGW